LRILLPIYHIKEIMSKILNISEAATIAIHSIGLIARSAKLISAQEIADITGFSKNHISKILQQLVKNGYLISTRGPKGGFLISPKARKASLLEIYNLIEGELEVNTCKMNCETCPFSSCIFGGLEQKFSKEFRNYLTGKKVAEL
jgi:Rrf2 family protein